MTNLVMKKQKKVMIVTTKNFKTWSGSQKVARPWALAPLPPSLDASGIDHALVMWIWTCISIGLIISLFKLLLDAIITLDVCVSW